MCGFGDAVAQAGNKVSVAVRTIWTKMVGIS